MFKEVYENVLDATQKAAVKAPSERKDKQPGDKPKRGGKKKTE